MPMARCNDCGRVLNQDGTCSSALECNAYETHAANMWCHNCKHIIKETK